MEDQDPNTILPRRVINVTFKVDDLVVLYAAGRAVRQGTSLNALVNYFLESYADVAPPNWARPRRRRARRGLPAFAMAPWPVPPRPRVRLRLTNPVDDEPEDGDGDRDEASNGDDDG